MTSTVLENDLKAAIRSIPDYPKPGIMFRDITTLLGDARAFRRAVDELVQPWAGGKIDKVAGIEARGFILGGAVAHQVSAGFVPLRKKGKLPYKRVSIGYSLEYGIDEMEMHEDAIAHGERVILVDDLIATGGTAEAAVKLLKRIGANVLAACFIIDLPDLGGAKKIEEARRAGAYPHQLRRALDRVSQRSFFSRSWCSGLARILRLASELSSALSLSAAAMFRGAFACCLVVRRTEPRHCGQPNSLEHRHEDEQSNRGRQ